MKNQALQKKERENSLALFDIQTLGFSRTVFAFERASLRLADGLLLGDPARLAGGNKPTLVPDCAQHFTASHFFTKALQQGLLRLPRSQHDFRQKKHHLSIWIAVPALQKTLPGRPGSYFV